MDIPSVDETLSAQQFYILLALTDKTLHGYGIRGQVAYDSRGTVVMAPGTAYTLLKRMLAKGLVEQVDAIDGRAKVTRRYRLTSYGRTRLEGEAKRLREIAEHARYKLASRML